MKIRLVAVLVFLAISFAANAMGDDMEHGVALKPGSVFILPAGHVHRTWTGDEETIIQLSFIGPSAVTFVNPDDDPRKKK